MLELNKLYLMDCMEGMKTFPDKYFDLAIVDPPYGIGKRILGTWGNQKETGINNAVKWDYKPPEEYWIELFRISNNQIIWGANNFIEHLYSSMGIICWDKMNGTNNLSDFEFAWTSFTDKTARMFRMHHFSAGYDDKIHPTQKPTDLYKWLLKKYVECSKCEGTGEIPSTTIDCDVQTCPKCKGETMKIIDTHVGSGSSIIAFLDYGCEWIGFEIDPDYHKAASERIKIHKMQTKLF